jgi:hypothetical protein
MHGVERDDFARHVEFFQQFLYRRYLVGVPLTSAKPWYRPMTTPLYIDGLMAITRFDATDWPSARSTITEMLKNIYNRMVRFIEQGE